MLAAHGDSSFSRPQAGRQRVPTWLWGLASALALALIGLVVLPGALLLQTAPSVAAHDDIETADIARAWQLLRSNDPRRQLWDNIEGEERRAAVVAGERDLELLLNHGLQRWLVGHVRVRMGYGTATVEASTRWPLQSHGPWLNLRLRLAETAGMPTLTELRVGHMALPPALARAATPLLLRHLGVADGPALADELLRWVKFMPGQMHLVYAWPQGAGGRVVEALLPAGEQQRLRAYSDRLVELTHTRSRPLRWEVPLSELLGPMFMLARQRSAAGGDAVAENRAAIVALTFFANGRSLGSVLPAARAWPQPRRMRVVLSGRDDFPLHFLISAALAVETTLPLARQVGLFKELKDSRGGSGFSFNDVAANMAGTRFGEAAMRDPSALQRRLAGGVEEALFMPAVADLPEFMAEDEFLRRFGGIGAPAYAQQMTEIERRVAVLPLFR